MSPTQLQINVIPVTPLQQNASIIWSTETKEGVIVDPGGDFERLKERIDELEIKVTAIWLTHGHIDHVGAATACKEEFGCEIVGPHKDDKFLLDEAERQAEKYDIAGARNVEPDRWLEEGDSVELAGLKFDILHCPGHSPGSVVFVQPEMQFALVGDVLFNGSIGRTDLPGGSFEQLIESIKTKLWALSPEIQFLPGHGPGSTFQQERADNPFVSDAVLGN